MGGTAHFADPEEGLWTVSPPCRCSDVRQNTAARDQLLIALAQRVVALRLQRKGQTHRLLELRISAANNRADMLQIAAGPGLVNHSIALGFIQRGARYWNAVLSDQGQRLSPPRRPQQPTNRTFHARRQPPLAYDASSTYLIHSTRSCVGPWPQQSQSEYLDDLIWDRPDADHSLLATLVRIVRQRRLIAGTATIRSGHPVVCFSHVSLATRAGQRTYRRHRVRWDYEPFGLAIDVRWGRERGIRPVQYGPESTWQRLACEERPFFQCTSSRTHST